MENARVIFLNGTSSSGKSTLARALQAELGERVFLHAAEDAFFAMLPDRAHEHPGFLRYGARLYDGFARSVAALAASGNRVIVDTVAWSPGSLAAFVRALRDTRVLAVGVRCDLAVLEERERRRRDRSVGQARRQFDATHRDALYDVEVDTSHLDVAACVAAILDTWHHPPPGESAFARMRTAEGTTEDGASGS